jgi:ribosomal protein L29
MKRSKFNEELQQLKIDELKQKAEQLQRELFSIRLNASTAHVKDYSQFNKLRKNIARVLTSIKQKEQHSNNI